MSTKALEPGLVCPNCESTHVEQYCAQCGQKRPSAHDYAMRTVLVAAIERVLQYDGRLLRTLRQLVRHPGRIARDHFEGKRSRYVAPFELFVFANVAAWLAVPYLHIYGFSMLVVSKLALFRNHWPSVFAWRESLAGITHDAFVLRLDAATSTVNKMTVLCMVPLFALTTKIVLAGRGYRMVQHFIFSVHFYCVHLTAILVTWGLVLIPSYRYLVAHPEVAIGHSFVTAWRSGWVQHFSVAPILLPYLYFATKTTFALGPRGAAVRAVVLTIAACTLLRSFFDIASVLMLFFV